MLLGKNTSLISELCWQETVTYYVFVHTTTHTCYIHDGDQRKHEEHAQRL